MSKQRISHSAQEVVPLIERDLTRRLCLAGLGGSAFALSPTRLLAQPGETRPTVVTPDGISRTTLESYENGRGEEFKLVLTVYPPGIGLPVHHHPGAGHNYVLEGVAESQYEGEALKRFTAGQSYQDKGLVPHLIFRNGDGEAPLKYLIAYIVKRGQPFLIIP
jgi:quercetin dioxygenase-like cupin family protein